MPSSTIWLLFFDRSVGDMTRWHNTWHFELCFLWRLASQNTVTAEWMRHHLLTAIKEQCHVPCSKMTLSACKKNAYDVSWIISCGASYNMQHVHSSASQIQDRFAAIFHTIWVKVWPNNKFVTIGIGIVSWSWIDIITAIFKTYKQSSAEGLAKVTLQQHHNYVNTLHNRHQPQSANKYQ